MTAWYGSGACRLDTRSAGAACVMPGRTRSADTAGSASRGLYAAGGHDRRRERSLIVALHSYGRSGYTCTVRRVASVASVASTLCALLLAVYSPLIPSLIRWGTQGNDPSPLALFLASNDGPITLVLAGIVVGGGIARAVLRHYLGAADARRKAEILTDYVHRRLWGDGIHGEPHKLIRLSLFVPRRKLFPRGYDWSLRFILMPRVLTALHRTDGTRPKREWLIDCDGVNGVEVTDGIAGQVFARRAVAWAVAVPQNPEPDPGAIAAYCREAGISEEMYSKHSWPGCAILGVPVQTAASKEPVAVLIIESRDPDKPELMPSGGLYVDAGLCSDLLGSKW